MGKRQKTVVSDFKFLPCAHGAYSVTYTSPATGKQWRCIVTDMELIDLVLLPDKPKQCDLEWLKYLCKKRRVDSIF